MIDLIKWEKLRAGHTAKPKVRFDLFYYCEGDGNGDLLYNTCREIIDRDDQSIWAHLALEKVFVALELGVRWPIKIDDFIKSGNHSRLDMTQDPWIMAYCCADHLGCTYLIEKHKPSIKIFNLPDKWAFRRALLGKPNLYWLWRRITPYQWMQDFVYVFYGYMEKAYLHNRV